MSRRAQVALVAAAGVLGAMFAAVPAHANPDDPAGSARERLRQDADGRVHLVAGADGRTAFVGTSARAEIDNPAVDSEDSVRSAARAHLDRYGAALDPAPGTSYAFTTAGASTAGTDVVRYQQEVDGIPVLGGEVVVTVGRERDLRSISGDVSASADVSAARVSSSRARRTALGLVARAHPQAELQVQDLGRWALDPEVAGIAVPGGPRTVRRVEVGDGAGIRDMVLVDDHSGAVVFRTSLIEEIDRVVCDNNNLRQPPTPCASDGTLPSEPGRAEGGAPSTVEEVNQAYEATGRVSDLYAGAGIDLTTLIGVDTPTGRHLASTVRFCTDDLDPFTDEYLDPCPYPNAFWNGSAMFYGSGFAAAEDVVGHEITHGFIERTSQLFGWGQSGAINESMADVVGEVVDHRHGNDDDSPWAVGEDLAVGPIRSMKDPTLHGDPDRMTSASYDMDPDYEDNGGVHRNSGIANKAAYLISQGGTFNGQTITGIDGNDPTLAKTLRLYLGTIQALPSGAEFVDLARVLDQTCADLVGSAAAGFTAANCATVHQAGVATELATLPPPGAAPAADAPTACPAGTTKRVLLDSEADSGSLVHGGTWTRDASALQMSNASSGTTSWWTEDPGTASSSPLSASQLIALPEGQQSFLSFQNWYLFDHYGADYFDGGTVELAVDSGSFNSVAAGPWINGPDKVLETGTGNSAGGSKAFSGDSHGWSISRLDLTSYAGHGVRPQFTMRSDAYVGSLGWYLDDIAVYTCDPLPPSAVRGLRADGFVGGLTISWAPPAIGSASVTAYWVSVSPCGIARQVSPTTTSLSVLVTAGRCGGTFEVTVGGTGRGGVGFPPASIKAARVGVGYRITRNGARLTFVGQAATFGKGVGGVPVRIQRKVGTRWVTVRTVTTSRSGTFRAKLWNRKRAYYRFAYLGGPGLAGSVATSRRRW